MLDELLKKLLYELIDEILGDFQRKAVLEELLEGVLMYAQLGGVLKEVPEGALRKGLNTVSKEVDLRKKEKERQGECK